MTYRLRRRCAAALAALLTSSTIILAPSAVAATPGGSLACTGTSDISYNPGLTLLEQIVTMNQNDLFFPCTSTNPGVTTGAGAFSGPQSLSCLSPLPVGSATYTIHWNDGSSSTMALTYTMTSTLGQVVATIQGFVSAGAFAGSTVLGSWTYVSLDLLKCLSGGVIKQIGAIVLTITGPA